jgi:hypothetical protein
MAEITLSDLLAWEPRLSLTGVGGPGQPNPGLERIESGMPVSGGSGGTGTAKASGLGGAKRWAAELEREITWAVTARASSPMLPPLRGGELVILPRRVLIDSGVSLSLLLRELASHSVVAIVLEQPLGDPSPLPALLAVPTSSELEGEINRLLTERRGEIYRAGTEVERILSDLTTTGADLDQVLGAAAGVLGVPVGVTDARGNPLAAGGRALPGGAGVPAGDGWPVGGRVAGGPPGAAPVGGAHPLDRAGAGGAAGLGAAGGG